MKIHALTVCGAALVFVGALWTGQGLGYIHGSFMTGSSLWAVIGPIVALVGLGLLLQSRRRRP
jgi:MYXO-CTERM domain-containing protein